MIASLLAGVATSSWARTAAELARLPDGPAITEMLSGLPPEKWSSLK